MGVSRASEPRYRKLVIVRPPLITVVATTSSANDSSPPASADKTVTMLKISSGNTTFFTKFGLETTRDGERETTSENTVKISNPENRNSPNSRCELSAARANGTLTLKTMPKTSV